MPQNTAIFVKSFIIRGIGYRAQIINNNWLIAGNSNELQQVAAYEFFNKRYLIIRVGYSYIVYLSVPNNIGVLIFKKDRKLVLYSRNLPMLSTFAQSIFVLRPPSVYTGRGIRIKKFLHRRKVGKKDVRKGRAF